MKISAILFDLDDTLMSECPAEDEAFVAACELARERYDLDPDALHKAVRSHAEELWQTGEWFEFGDSIGMASWEAMWASFEGDDPRLAELKKWALEYRPKAWNLALADFDIDDAAFANELLERYQHERHMRHKPFDDAAELLEDLRGEFKLGLLTNGAPDVQQTKLDGSGLEPYFDAVVITGKIGIGKPDPRPFEIVLEQLDVPASEAVMVGNSMVSDVLGAHNAGVKSIWLNLDGTWAVDGITPDVEIHSLKELRPALEKLDC